MAKKEKLLDIDLEKLPVQLIARSQAEGNRLCETRTLKSSFADRPSRQFTYIGANCFM